MQQPTNIEERKQNLDPTNPTGLLGVARAQRGYIPENLSPHRSLGEIKSYNAKTNSYDILIDDRVIPSVPIKTLRPGSVSPLPSGTTIVLDESVGIPFIDGVIPSFQETAVNVESMRVPLRLGTENTIPLESAANTATDADYWRVAGIPTDAMPEEFVETTPEGNYIGILRGKLNILHSSPKSQIITDGNHDLVKVICEDYEHFSALGTATIKNEEGRSSLVVRYGADQLNESGGSEGQWTFRLDIGNSGSLFKMEVTEGDGKTKAKFHISPDGRVTIMGSNGVHILNSGTGVNHEELAGSKSTRIKGAKKLDVEGNINVKTLASRSTTITATDSTMVGNDHAVITNRDQIVNVGRNQSITVTGGSLAEAKPTNIAVDYKVLNGSYNLSIGEGASSPAAMASYNLFVAMGGITIGANPKAIVPSTTTIALNTTIPGSVGLGGFPPAHPNFALQKGVMDNAMLFTQFNTLMTNLILWLDTHVHKCSAPTVDSAPPTVLSTATLTPLVPKCASTTVFLK